MEVPTLDVSQLYKQDLDLNTKKLLADELIEALSTFGFVYFINTPIKTNTPHSISNFFNSPLSEKLKIKAEHNRGYIGTGGESGGNNLELKEGFSYGNNKHGKESNEMNFPNVWPNNEMGIQMEKEMNLFYEEMVTLSKHVVHLVELGLNMELNSIWKHCTKGQDISLMRIFKYFPKTKDNNIGSSEHTDWGFLTLICQNQQGLEAFYKGMWQPIPNCIDKTNSVLLNCGDYLSMLTNGKLISPIHRVILTQEERISGVFFFYPDYETNFPELNSGQNYSLLKNQEKGGKEFEINREEVFGKFIETKWKQVSRKY